MNDWYLIATDLLSGKVFSLKTFASEGIARNAMAREAQYMEDNLEGDEIDDDDAPWYSLESGPEMTVLSAKGSKIMSWCVRQATA